MNKKTKQEEYYFKMLQLEKECIVDASVILDYPPVALSLGEKLIKSKKGDQLLPIPIGTYGNFSLVQSEPKAKKTFFISLLASVYLSGSNKVSLVDQSAHNIAWAL